jgi:hypothetical protein
VIAAGQEAVGWFPGPVGERLGLVRVDGDARDGAAGMRHATLEELVLGHLAAGRPDVKRRWAA